MALSDRTTATPRRAKHHDTPAADGAGAREQLLDAAITLFAERGYDGVSTVAVGKAAGLTQSMVHYYFGTKASLWEAAVERVLSFREHFGDYRRQLFDVDQASQAPQNHLHEVARAGSSRARRPGEGASQSRVDYHDKSANSTAASRPSWSRLGQPTPG